MWARSSVGKSVRFTSVRSEVRALSRPPHISTQLLNYHHAGHSMQKSRTETPENVPAHRHGEKDTSSRETDRVPRMVESVSQKGSIERGADQILGGARRQGTRDGKAHPCKTGYFVVSYFCPACCGVQSEIAYPRLSFPELRKIEAGRMRVVIVMWKRDTSLGICALTFVRTHR